MLKSRGVALQVDSWKLPNSLPIRTARLHAAEVGYGNCYLVQLPSSKLRRTCEPWHRQWPFFHCCTPMTTTLRESGALSETSVQRGIWKVRLRYGLRSVPAVAATKRTVPAAAAQPDPAAWNSRPLGASTLIPSTPTPIWRQESPGNSASHRNWPSSCHHPKSQGAHWARYRHCGGECGPVPDTSVAPSAVWQRGGGRRQPPCSGLGEDIRPG